MYLCVCIDIYTSINCRKREPGLQNKYTSCLMDFFFYCSFKGPELYWEKCLWENDTAYCENTVFYKTSIASALN